FALINASPSGPSLMSSLSRPSGRRSLSLYLSFLLPGVFPRVLQHGLVSQMPAAGATVWKTGCGDADWSYAHRIRSSVPFTGSPSSARAVASPRSHFQRNLLEMTPEAPFHSTKLCSGGVGTLQPASGVAEHAMLSWRKTPKVDVPLATYTCTPSGDISTRSPRCASPPRKVRP